MLSLSKPCVRLATCADRDRTACGYGLSSDRRREQTSRVIEEQPGHEEMADAVGRPGFARVLD